MFLRNVCIIICIIIYYVLECVLYSLQTLIRSMKRFPLDKYSIYKCISSLGLHHSSFIQSLVVELLGIHPIFDTPEQNIEDDCCKLPYKLEVHKIIPEFVDLAKLILVLNAASTHNEICSLIPSYVEKHYRYLRRSLPNLIPKIIVSFIKQLVFLNELLCFSNLKSLNMAALSQTKNW